jgi:hypothetical protein
MTLGDVAPAAAACGEEAEAGRTRRACVRDVAGHCLADERRHGLALAASDGAELALEPLVDEDRGPFHMTYDIIHHLPGCGPK